MATLPAAPMPPIAAAAAKQNNDTRDISEVLNSMNGTSSALEKTLEKGGPIYWCTTEVKAYKEGRRSRGRGNRSRVPSLKDVFWRLRHGVRNFLTLHTLYCYVDRIREDGNAFTEYSDVKYKHHPYHWNKTILCGVASQLNIIFEEAVRLLGQLPERMYDVETTLYTEDIMTLGHFVENKVPTLLRNIARTIRSRITVLQNGFYSKTHSSDIALALRRGTSERSAVIKEMVENKCVPCERALRDVINLRENGLFFVEEEWNIKRGRKINQGILWSAREHNDQNFFEGQFTMALLPVILYDNQKTSGKSKVPQIDAAALYSPPQQHDVCDFISVSTDERLYFSPKQFPTPIDLNEAGKNSTFQLLRTYIEYASEKGGSPVVCKYGKPGSKRFVCKHSKDCKYFFLVKWDKYGYYIHLYNEKLEQHVGNRWHNHKRILAHPNIKFECKHCRKAFPKLSDAIEHEDNLWCSDQNEKK